VLRYLLFVSRFCIASEFLDIQNILNLLELLVLSLINCALLDALCVLSCLSFINRVAFVTFQSPVSCPASLGTSKLHTMISWWAKVSYNDSSDYAL
jgi:hypothetical protein